MIHHDFDWLGYFWDRVKQTTAQPRVFHGRLQWLLGCSILTSTPIIIIIIIIISSSSSSSIFRQRLTCSFFWSNPLGSFICWSYMILYHILKSIISITFRNRSSFDPQPGLVGSRQQPAPGSPGRTAAAALAALRRSTPRCAARCRGAADAGGDLALGTSAWGCARNCPGKRGKTWENILKSMKFRCFSLQTWEKTWVTWCRFQGVGWMIERHILDNRWQ